MGNAACFGLGNDPSHITDTDRAVLDLKILQRNLRNRASVLERALSTQKELYRWSIGAEAAGKRGEKHHLFLRHIGALQKALDQCHMYSYRVDEMLLDISEQATLQQVTETMKDATRAMDRMTKLMSVSDVESMLREGAMARERHRELQVALEGGRVQAQGEEYEYYVNDAELEELREELQGIEGVPNRMKEVTTGTMVAKGATVVIEVTGEARDTERMAETERQLLPNV